ncbi:MAG: hypothetical protein COB67_06825 [SAR324 cluster bacterium]|uniref:Uncharacterized protein n=1 Tax=SAR324 cluster bacterium TaxID=2024889 RepID=A0A2A4T5L5_9DELT|nr:MAG: hypothetical protein COB67_06825 [SAR324 cluster bacterium]
MTTLAKKKSKTTTEDMSLRDWYAGKALNGLLSNPEKAGNSVEEISELAYRYADAMLRKGQK